MHISQYHPPADRPIISPPQRITRGTHEQVYMDGGVVARTKAGCIEGYRSDVVFIPDLQLGVFAAISSTCDIHGDGDMLAFPVASKLVPAVDAALRPASELG